MHIEHLLCYFPLHTYDAKLFLYFLITGDVCAGCCYFNAFPLFEYLGGFRWKKIPVINKFDCTPMKKKGPPSNKFDGIYWFEASCSAAGYVWPLNALRWVQRPFVLRLCISFQLEPLRCRYNFSSFLLISGGTRILWPGALSPSQTKPCKMQKRGFPLFRSTFLGLSYCLKHIFWTHSTLLYLNSHLYLVNTTSSLLRTAAPSFSCFPRQDPPLHNNIA